MTKYTKNRGKRQATAWKKLSVEDQKKDQLPEYMKNLKKKSYKSIQKTCKPNRKTGR